MTHGNVTPSYCR